MTLFVDLKTAVLRGICSRIYAIITLLFHGLAPHDFGDAVKVTHTDSITILTNPPKVRW